MAVRNFNGTTDRLQTAVGGVSGMTFGTFAFIIKRGTTSDVQVVTGLHNSGGTLGGAILFDGTSLGIAADADNVRGMGTPIANTTTWYLLVVRKATGSATARGSVFNFSTSSWAHVNASSALDNWTSPGSGGLIRFDFSNTLPWNGRIAARALWANALPWSADTTGDSNLISAGLHTSLANWVSASPSVLHVFNQAAVTDDVLDLIGSADQTARTGTTVITGDDPPGFDFGGEEPASGTFAVQDEATVQWTGEAPVVPGAGGVFAVTDEVTVEWSGQADRVVIWSDPVFASTLTDVASGTFAVTDEATVQWSGQRDSAASFEVQDEATVAWTGQAPVVGEASGTFAVTDETTVAWVAARDSAASFDVQDETTVAWTGEAPAVPGAGGIFAVTDETTVAWTGARDSAGVYAVDDVVTVEWHSPTTEPPVDLRFIALAPVFAHGPALAPATIDRLALAPELVHAGAGEPVTVARAAGEPELGHGPADAPESAHSQPEAQLGHGQPGEPTT